MSVTSKNILVSFDDEGIYIYTVAGRDVKKQMFRLSQFTALGAILHFINKSESSNSYKTWLLFPEQLHRT
jgi:hypothetical protein